MTLLKYYEKDLTTGDITTYYYFDGALLATKWCTKMDKRNLTLLGLVLLLLLAIAFFPTACSDYKTFSSGMKELDFTFKYPRQWNISITEKYTDLAYVDITGQGSDNESPVKVTVNDFFTLGTRAEQEANDIVSGRTSPYSIQLNFNLIRHDTVTLNGIRGYRAEYTFDFDQYFMRHIQEGRYILTHELDMTFPRKGRVYEIWISASQNEWNVWEKDIQYVIDTFRWK